MNKREWKKIGYSIIVVGLFILVLVTVMNFDHKNEDVVIDTGNMNVIPEENVDEFKNESGLEEQEIRLLVEEKRSELKDFFKDAKYYAISEVGASYTKEDDNKYIVVDESFLNRLRNLLTVDAYETYWKEFTEITPKENISVKERIYMARIDLFDPLYVQSAIAMIEVTEEKLILKSATDERIVAKENIRNCEDETNCKRDEFYKLILEKEDDTWKIAEFTEADFN